MTPVRVLVVDDSLVCRALLREILERDGDIEVVAEAADGTTAVQCAAEVRPDLVTMDVGLPGISGLDAVGEIMARWPTPVLVVTGLPAGPDTDLAFQAVQRGALDLVGKPAAHDLAAGAALRAHVRALARVPVVRHVAGGRSNRRVPGGDAVVAPPGPLPPAPAPVGVRPIVGIGASAGGPAAVVKALEPLPPTFPGCVALVQHLPVGFTASFATYLRHRLVLQVEVVQRATSPRPGTVLLPPDDRHLVAQPDGTFGPSDAPPHGGHRPAASVLLSSIARVFGGAAIGVVLSGIGDDGADGLRELRERGALTVAQDEASCAVYGMPRAALDGGGAGLVLPPGDIALLLMRMAGSGRAGTEGAG